MDFTLRFTLATLLVLLCSWSTESTIHPNRSIRQVNLNGDSKTTDKLQKIEAETTTQQSLLVNVSDRVENKAKTDNSSEGIAVNEKDSTSRLQNSEPRTAEAGEEKAREDIGRSINIDKYISKEFHSKNNVYKLPLSPDTEKYIKPDYDFQRTTLHNPSEDFDFYKELTTPKSLLFDSRYKEAVESVDQELEHIDETNEFSEESDSTESIKLEMLINESKKNDSEANLHYINYKNIVSNNTGDRSNLHKDVVVEAGTNLDFRNFHNHTTIIDDDDDEDDDSKNNTVVKESYKEKNPEASTLSNMISAKSDQENAESSTSKNIAVTTKKTVVIMKPSSNKNLSHISILSNNIETETVKAINPAQINQGEKEIIQDMSPLDTPLNVSKRPSVVIDMASSEVSASPNEIKKTGVEHFRETPENASVKPEKAVALTTATEEPDSVTSYVTDDDSEGSFSFLRSTIPSEITTAISTESNPEITTATLGETEVATVTSVIIETSTTQWERVTTDITKIEPKTEFYTESTTNTEISTEGTTASGLTYQADTTATNTEIINNSEETTTSLEETTSSVENHATDVTTENTLRTLAETELKDTITTISSITTTTEEVQVTSSTEPMTTGLLPKSKEIGRIDAPIYKSGENTEPTIDLENTTDINTITSEFYGHDNTSEDNSGTIAAITISSIGAVCLILLAGLLIIIRKRQKRFNYGQRCRPVSLDDYSMDNVSVYNSVRRKGLARTSKRSYGNPAFEDPVCVSHPLNFSALGKFANNPDDMKAEFEDIPQITARMNELPEGCDTKNRYANVIPLPETRVFLTPLEGQPNSDYINANYVTGPKNIKGYYIACQAPLSNTVDDFWRMIWEQQSKVILMLTHLFENGVEKCVDYLPPSEVLDCHRLFGDFQITLKKREVKDKYIISSLQLKNMVSNSWREVTHFWYLGWPEKGVPSEANSLIAFLIEARSYMKSSSLDRKEVTKNNLTNGLTKNEINPVVVHCSPGTGRTGVVLACDIAIREFEQTRLVDVPRIVYKIRRDRASAVQTKEQYAFIYKVINLYATKLTGGVLDSL